MNSVLQFGNSRHVLWYDDVSEVTAAQTITREFNATASQPGVPLKVTLVWNDPGDASLSGVLVNDLDLEVDDGDRVWRGNHALSDQNGGSGADRLNNVEQVWIRDHPSGNATIRVMVIGHRVSTTSQPYALVVTGNVIGERLFSSVAAVATVNITLLLTLLAMLLL